jgi:hypothetical protein
MQHQQEFHYTVRPTEDGFECLVVELGQKVEAETFQAALSAGERLVAADLEAQARAAIPGQPLERARRKAQ